MSTHKTKASLIEAKKFLHASFDKRIGQLTIIPSGEISQAFSFRTQKGEFILRVNWRDQGFAKDDFAYKHFHRVRVPIPQIYLHTKFNDHLVATVAEKIPGKILDDLSTTKVLKLLPQLLETLDAIHQIDISAYPGFGPWDEHGNANYGSWPEYLYKLPYHFQYVANHLQGQELIKKATIEMALERYTALLHYCPNIHHLIHGDFGFNNVLSDGEQITGVLDWELGRYGDWLFDDAWLTFWGTEINYAQILQRHYDQKKIKVPHFRQRLLCYMLHVGLESLHFFSESQQGDKYDWTEKRLLSILKEF